MIEASNKARCPLAMVISLILDKVVCKVDVDRSSESEVVLFHRWTYKDQRIWVTVQEWKRLVSSFPLNFQKGQEMREGVILIISFYLSNCTIESLIRNAELFSYHLSKVVKICFIFSMIAEKLDNKILFCLSIFLDMAMGQSECLEAKNMILSLWLSSIG